MTRTDKPLFFAGRWREVDSQLNLVYLVETGLWYKYHQLDVALDAIEEER